MPKQNQGEKKRKVGSPKAKKNALKRSFEQAAATPKSAPSTPEEIQKTHQSGFLSYCRSAAASKNDAVSRQALEIIETYRGMSQEEKKKLVVSFFRGRWQEEWPWCHPQANDQHDRGGQGEGVGRLLHTSHDHEVFRGLPQNSQ